MSSPSSPSGDHRPFNDPKHPSWYSDATEEADQLSRQEQAEQPARPQNPYADQPLGGPYGNGQPQYPIDGQYPVIANPSDQQDQDQRGQHGHQGRSQQAHPGAGRQAQPSQHQRQSGEPYSSTGRAQSSTPSSTLGIIAMVSGIIGVVTGGVLILPQLAAVIVGHLGLRREPHSQGFSIAGLVMGYLVLAFWVGIILLVVMAGAFAGFGY